MRPVESQYLSAKVKCAEDLHLGCLSGSSIGAFRWAISRMRCLANEDGLLRPTACVALSSLSSGCVGIKLSARGFVLRVLGFGGFVGGGAFGLEVPASSLLGVIRAVWGPAEDGVPSSGIDACLVSLGT